MLDRESDVELIVAVKVEKDRPKVRQWPMSNPVSLRLYNVLGTTFDDDATTDALQTLSELYATPAVNSKDISNDVLDDEDDGSVHQSALLQETVPSESAARARKNLRRDMENKLTEGSRQFLKAFAEVDQVCVFRRLVSYGMFSQVAVLNSAYRNWTNCRSMSPLCALIVIRLRHSCS